MDDEQQLDRAARDAEQARKGSAVREGVVIPPNPEQTLSVGVVPDLPMHPDHLAAMNAPARKAKAAR